MKKDAVKLFQKHPVRSAWDEEREKWWFSVLDVVAILTEQADYTKTRNYWKWLKGKLTDEGSQLVSNTNQLKMVAADGKKYNTDVMDTEQILRLVQSIPSKKAEPFKRWLARVGYERVQEIENPELAQKRMKMLYKLKGYPDDWIERRTQGMEVRHELTEEWQKRGVTEERDYFPKISRTTAVSFHGSRLPLIILNCSWPIPVMSTMSPFLAEPSARSMASRRSGSSVIVAPPTFSMPSRIISRMASESSL